ELVAPAEARCGKLLWKITTIQTVENLFEIIILPAWGQQAFSTAFAPRRVDAAANRRPESIRQVALPRLARGAASEDTRQQDFRQRLQHQGRSLRQHVRDAGVLPGVYF